jgi:preprotein translocase subunit SecA
MNVQYKKIVDDFIESKALQDKAATFTTAIIEALDWVDKHVPSDIFNIAAIGSKNENTYKEQEKARAILFDFLGKSINFNSKPAVFLSKSAPVFKAQTFDVSDLNTGDVHIYQSFQNLGIQEKYIRGVLTKKHWLTDLDIQRALKSYDLSGKIRISPFTESSLRATIDLAVKDNASANQPYIIPLMLNRGSSDGSQGTHWLSAQISIVPAGRKVTYTIDDSLELSEAEKQNYKDIIESAMADKRDEFHNPFPQDMAWSIDSDNSSIAGHASQKDGFSCGYRALRQLLGNDSIRGNNLKAKEYSDLAFDSDALVSCLFRQQLNDLSIPVEVFDSLDAKGQEKFQGSYGSDIKFKTVLKEKINSLLSLTDKVRNEACDSHWKVEEVVGSFNPTVKLLTFPEGKKDLSLTAVEYHSFFNKLHDIENIAKSSLKRINLPHVTCDALDGITSYFSTNPLTASKELGLFIDEEPGVNKERFFGKLKLSLNTLSKAGLEIVELRDDGNLLNATDIAALKEFAVQVDITCKIKLPETYTTSSVQRELDKVVERNQLKKNSICLSVEQKVTAEKVAAVKNIRKRETFNAAHSRQVDIELQDSVEAEVAMTVALEKTQEATKFAYGDLFSLEKLRDAVNKNDFKRFEKLELIMGKTDFIQSWHQLFGNIINGELKIGTQHYKKTGNQDVYESSFISQISEEALEKLLKDGNLPAGGIDFQHLPQGFVLIGSDNKQGGLILHFDANYKKSHPVSPIISEQPSVTPLSIDLTDEIVDTLPSNDVLRSIWTTLNNSALYDVNKSLQFRRMLLDVLVLPAADQQTLIELCGGPNLDLNKLDVFFKNRTKLASLSKDASGILDELAVNKLLDLAGSEADNKRKSFISLAGKGESIAVTEHPLFKITTADLDTAGKLEKAKGNYNLTPVVLNDLTRIYSSHGAAGINKVLNTWESISKLKNIKREFAEQIIANSNPQKEIITSSELLTHCTQLNDLNSAQRDWFMKLYANHSPKSDKDFVALSGSFIAFSKEIHTTYGLKFYSLDDNKPRFTANIDMRTAMGRMLSIMAGCKREDLGAQWERISEIDLRSSTAVRAMKASKSENRRCYFVVPEMVLNPDDSVINNKPYDTVLTPNDIAPTTIAIAPKTKSTDEDKEIIVFNADDSKDVQKRLFRYLSYQEHRMPLSFYTKAIEQIEEMGKRNTKLTRTELNILYRLLAETTTGKNYAHFIRDPDAAKKQWTHILERIEGCQLRIEDSKNTVERLTYFALCKVNGKDINTEIYQEMFASLGKLNTLPSIEVMGKLVTLMTDGIYKFNAGEINQQQVSDHIRRLEQSNRVLSQTTQCYNDKVYLGMKFYNEPVYQKTYRIPENCKEIREVYGDTVNLFDHHTLVAWSIDQLDFKIYQNQTDPTRRFVNFAMPLISTFSLDIADIPKIGELHAKAKSPISSALMEYFGNVLQDIENNTELNAQSLISLMKALVDDGGLFVKVANYIIQEYYDLDKKKILTPEENERYLLLKSINSYPFGDDAKSKLIKLAKPFIAEFIKGRPELKQALPQGYADNLIAKESSANIALHIEQEFKTQELRASVKIICARLFDIPEEDLIKVIKDVSLILKHCETESEKLQVLEDLANLQLFSEGSASYKNLLDAIKKTGSSIFVYFLQEAQAYNQRNTEPLEGLCQKATYFIGEAIPRLASRYQNLNMVEFAPLIATVINAGKVDELTSNVVVGDSYFKWDALLTNITTSASNPDQLEKALDGLGEDIEVAATLKKHLEELKKPLITRVKVSSEEEEVKTLGENTVDGLTEYSFRTQEVTVPKDTGFLKKVWSFFTPQNPETEVIKKIYKTTTTFKENRVPDSLDVGLVGAVINQVQSRVDSSVGYAHALTESIALIDQLVEAYPSAKSMLLPLTKNYLEHKNGTESSEEHIKHAYSNLKSLHEQLAVLDDKDMTISLCEHFSDEGEYKFTDLMAIFNGATVKLDDKSFDFAAYPSLSSESKKQLFTVVTSLLNNKKTCDLSGIAQLITDLSDKSTGETYLEAIKATYSKAPYPELAQFNVWWQKSQSDPSDAIVHKYKEWSKKPVEREDGALAGEEAINGFNLEYAKEQYRKMSGIEYTDQELANIKHSTEAVKEKTADEILARINEIRANPQLVEDPTELTALLAELLYRTKGMPQEGAGNDRKWGNSFEINTTQYLAVHSLLKSNKPTIAGIGTGEGKSRIMMISIAAQWVLGRTVDFVTADVTLATRDYLEYQAYFKSIGANTNLITAQTPVEQYCLDGINFSDASNLSLYRNKAHSQGLGDKVLNPKKENRCLLLDEADKTLFDTIDTRYNYSQQADQSIRDMPWIYEGLVRFFQDPLNVALFHGNDSNADECNRKFKAYVKRELGIISDKDIQKLEGLSRNQLESWQASAITALNLEYGKDFTLEAKVAIVDKKGPGIVSQARLISGGTASKNAKFSFGVHQCLHARLNLESRMVANNGAIEGNLLHQALSKDEFKGSRFPVDSENQIIYSSTSKALVDDYDVLRGVTGTPGAWTERAEKANIAFIDIPRHRGMKRIDRPFLLARNEELQFKQLIAEIRISIANNQPALLICKDDKESERLFHHLNENLTQLEKEKLNRVSADTTRESEVDFVENKAGQPGAITVTTPRMGRGTDIKLHGDAKTNGLHVVCTFLPKERDYIQIIGRAGRFGARGSSRLILNEESIRNNFSKVNNGSHAFYTATESYLTHLQKVMDVQSQKQRIIKDSVSDFRMNLTTSFFHKFYKPLAVNKEVNHDLMMEKWRKFFGNSDKIWNNAWPKIAELLAGEQIENVINELQNYHDEVQGYWEAMLEELKIEFSQNTSINFSELPEDVGNIKLTKRGIELLKYNAGVDGTFQTSIVDSYDRAYEGRAVIYKGFIRNLWLNVLPSIFSREDTPYTQARKNGHMSWSQFLLGGNLGSPRKTSVSVFNSSLTREQEMETVDIDLKGGSVAKIINLGVASQSGQDIPTTKENYYPNNRKKDVGNPLESNEPGQDHQNLLFNNRL